MDSQLPVHRSSQFGFGLIEVLISTFLLAIAAIAVTGLITLGTRFSVETERQNVAQALINEQIEYIRAIDYERVGYVDAMGQEPDGVLVRQQTLIRNDQSYNMTIDITLADDPNNGSIDVAGLNESTADYKEIILTTSWESAGGNVRQVAVTTIVAPAGSLTSCTPGTVTCPGGAVCPLNGLCQKTAPVAYCPIDAYFCQSASSGNFSANPSYNVRSGVDVYPDTTTQVEAVYTGFAAASPALGFCLANANDPPGSYIQFGAFEAPFLTNGEVEFDVSGAAALTPGFYEFRLGQQSGGGAFNCFNPAIAYRFEVTNSIISPPNPGVYSVAAADLSGMLRTSFTSSENVVVHWESPNASAEILLVGVMNTTSGTYVDSDYALRANGGVSFGFLPSGNYEVHVYTDPAGSPVATTAFTVVD